MIIFKLIGVVLASVPFMFVWAIDHIEHIKTLTNEDNKIILQITFGIYGTWILIASCMIGG